jgi:hypothetical protein
MKRWSFGIKMTIVRMAASGSGLAAGGGDRGAGVLFGLDVGEALLESGSGGVVTGDGLEGVFELAAVARQLVAGQGVQGMRGYGRHVHRVLRDMGYLLTILGGGRIVSYVAGTAATFGPV